MTYRRAEGAQGTQLVPGLAESAPKAEEDSSVFTFTLRKDLTYSDGRPVLAADVGARDQALARAESRRRAARWPASRRSTWTSAERTVRIRLGVPDPEFPGLLATLWTAPVPPGTPTRDLSRTPAAGSGPTGSRPPSAGGRTCSPADAASGCRGSRAATWTRSPAPWWPTAAGAPARRCPGAWT